MTRAEKIKQLNELGYETKIENGTLFIFLDDYENEKNKIYKLFEDYRHSYGVRPKVKPETDDFEKYMNKPEVENGQVRK